MSISNKQAILRRTILLSFVLWPIVLTISACSYRQTGIQATGAGGYDRVMKTGIIRCGYVLYPPYCMKDPNTGKLTGIFVEIVEKVGQKLGFKVIWPEEVGYESLFEGLRSNRYDIFAGGIWPNADRAKAGDFSIPMFYSALNAYCRSSDNRFSNKLNAANSSDIKIAVIDGAMDDLIAKSDFPLAKRVSLPALSAWSQNLLNITTKKADITFAEPGIISLFLKNNPGTLKQVHIDHPVRIFGNVYVFKTGDLELKNMIDTVLEELLNSGEVDKLIKKYEATPGAFYPVALPYRIN